MNGCGSFQTVIRIDPNNWPNTNSQTLQQLKAATIIVNGQILLSLKFVLDGYHNVPEDSGFALAELLARSAGEAERAALQSGTALAGGACGEP